MIKTYQRERLINSIVYFAKNTNYCGKTKLMKLLFYFDFYHFKKTGKTVTGLEYHAWPKGPVPKLLFEELSNMKPDMEKEIAIIQIERFQKIQAKKKFNSDNFTPHQLKLLEEIAFIFKEAKAEDMTEVTHLPNQPWHKTLTQKGKLAKIDYLLALDGTKDCLCEEDAIEIMNEVSEMYDVFGTA